jgi:hypothetical protein
MLRLTPSIHLSLDLPLLRVPSGSHSKISVAVSFLAFSLHVQTIVAVFLQLRISKMFFPTSMISLTVPFRTFSFLDFVADLLQKSISVASNLFVCCGKFNIREKNISNATFVSVKLGVLSY